MSSALIAYVHRLETGESPSGTTPISVVVLNRALSATSDRTSKLELFGVLGAIAGLGLGFALVATVAALRNKRIT